MVSVCLPPQTFEFPLIFLNFIGFLRFPLFPGKSCFAQDHPGTSACRCPTQWAGAEHGVSGIQKQKKKVVRVSNLIRAHLLFLHVYSRLYLLLNTFFLRLEFFEMCDIINYDINVYIYIYISIYIQIFLYIASFILNILQLN